MIPLRLYAYLALVLALIAGIVAWSVHERHVGAEDVRQEEREEIAVAQKRNDQLAADLETAKAQKKVIYATLTKTVDRIVDRPIYRDRDCLDDDGVMLVNAALVGQAASSPLAAVSATDAASR